MDDLCSVDGCGKPKRCKGMCSTHYNRTQPNRHKKQTVPCHYCGKAVIKDPTRRYERRFCNMTCRDMWRMETGIGCALGPIKSLTCKLPPSHPVRQLIQQMDQAAQPKELRSPIRIAWEAGDHAGLIKAIKTHCDTSTECWLWRRKSKSGYPLVSVGMGRTKQVHRIMLEAKLQKPLGKQQAHHMCANTLCVNPDHLQPVTARENVAEMLARRYLEQRITDLELALTALDPKHPLLAEVGINHGP